MAPAKLIQGLKSGDIKRYKKQLEVLLKQPLIKQKTQEWYDLRQNMITASDFAQALGEGKFGTKDQLIMKKCETSDVPFKSNMFFRWGNLFEPVACDLYSLMHDHVKIHEFGLLQHEKYKFFGASPDGISDLGIMLEIKCPLKRKIIPGGDVPTQYYYQIQGQLDVCNLEVCDYFECEFEKCENIQDLDDPEAVYIDRYRGVLIDRKDSETLYSPIILPGELAIDRLTSWVHAHKSESDIEIIYWSLDTFNEKRVYKDSKWVGEKLEELSQVWDKILYYRQHPDALKLEVGKCISIDTEPAFERPNRPPTGYAFRDVNDD